jgi:hypothetical protein
VRVGRTCPILAAQARLRLFLDRLGYKVIGQTVHCLQSKFKMLLWSLWKPSGNRALWIDSSGLALLELLQCCAGCQGLDQPLSCLVTDAVPWQTKTQKRKEAAGVFYMNQLYTFLIHLQLSKSHTHQMLKPIGILADTLTRSKIRSCDRFLMHILASFDTLMMQSIFCPGPFPIHSSSPIIPTWSSSGLSRWAGVW